MTKLSDIKVGDTIVVEAEVTSLGLECVFTETNTFFLHEIKEVKKRPFEVGDKVIHQGAPITYTIIAIDGNQAWIKAIYFKPCTVQLEDLIHAN